MNEQDETEEAYIGSDPNGGSLLIVRDGSKEVDDLIERNQVRQPKNPARIIGD